MAEVVSVNVMSSKSSDESVDNAFRICRSRLATGVLPMAAGPLVTPVLAPASSTQPYCRFSFLLGGGAKERVFTPDS
jgi:hypothetical protein